jgi:hypothetical protein
MISQCQDEAPVVLYPSSVAGVLLRGNEAAPLVAADVYEAPQAGTP